MLTTVEDNVNTVKLVIPEVVETIILDVLETPVEGTSVDKKDVEIDGIIGVPDDGVKIEVCFDDETDCVVENENGGKVNEPDDEVLTDAVKDDTVDVFPADVDGSETDDTGMLESGCSETVEVNVVILVSDVGGVTDDSVVKVNVVFVVT